MGEVDFLGVEDRPESRRDKLGRMVEGPGAGSELNREVGSGGGSLGRGVFTFSGILQAVGSERGEGRACPHPPGLSADRPGSRGGSRCAAAVLARFSVMGAPGGPPAEKGSEPEGSLSATRARKEHQGTLIPFRPKIILGQAGY